MNPRHDLARMLEEDDGLVRMFEEIRKNPNPLEAVSERPLGGSIKWLRLMTGLSLTELSESSGLQESFLKELEEETAELDFESVQQLSAAFNIRASCLEFIFELAEAVSAARS